jgi:hypothetical protein
MQFQGPWYISENYMLETGFKGSDQNIRIKQKMMNNYDFNDYVLIVFPGWNQ